VTFTKQMHINAIVLLIIYFCTVNMRPYACMMHCVITTSEGCHQKCLWCFHEILNHTNEIYCESQFMVYHGFLHGPWNVSLDQISMALQRFHGCNTHEKFKLMGWYFHRYFKVIFMVISCAVSGSVDVLVRCLHSFIKLL